MVAPAVARFIRKHTGRKLDRAIIATLSVALAYFVVYTFWISKHLATPQPETAAARDPGLIQLKTDPLLDPLRKEPRFQAVDGELKFPT